MLGRAPDLLPQTIKKIRARLIPLMVAIYIVASIDKVNVSFAGIQMTKALGIGPAVFGLGAGIFFISYTIFQVPSNLILHRVGARTWIARILFIWGIISTAMAFTQGKTSFYALRFLLGAAEAGFFPGLMLYMTLWFPQSERARIVASFIAAAPIAVIIGSPISGALLNLDGVLGIGGWRWLFLIEGLPAIALAFVTYRMLTDRPEQATWLSSEEREQLTQTLAQEARTRVARHRFTVLQALSNPRVILLGFLSFGQLVAMNGLVMWLPQVAKGFQLSNIAVGFVVTVPYIFAVATMLLWAKHSDKTGERIWHVAIPAFTGGIGLLISATTGSPILQLAGATLGVTGLYSAMPAFWALPTAFLGGAAAAGGLALINTIANFGGFVGPSLIGYIKEITGHYSWGIASMAAGAFLAGSLALTQLGSGGKPRPEAAEPVTHPTRP
jgi:ACS family tartrate transporter-like MFS transporter